MTCLLEPFKLIEIQSSPLPHPLASSSGTASPATDFSSNGFRLPTATLRRRAGSVNNGPRSTAFAFPSSIPDSFTDPDGPIAVDGVMPFDQKRAMGFPMTPSVGIIIYQSRLTMQRAIWGWLGWGREGSESQNPHPCAKNAQGWGTRREGRVLRCDSTDAHPSRKAAKDGGGFHASDGLRARRPQDSRQDAGATLCCLRRWSGLGSFRGRAGLKDAS